MDGISSRLTDSRALFFKNRLDPPTPYLRAMHYQISEKMPHDRYVSGVSNCVVNSVYQLKAYLLQNIFYPQCHDNEVS